MIQNGPNNSFIFKHKCISALALALLLSALCYLWELVPFSWRESFDKLYFSQVIIGNKRKQPLDDALFINIGYDKAIADTDLYNSGGLFVGRVAITDRSTIDHLLHRLEEDNVYKYIFLDVRFEKGIKSPFDSSLFHRIANMRDIVIATHHDNELASPLLANKAFLSDYKTTVTSSGFTRYQYIQHGQNTAPLKVYEDLTGRTIKRSRFLPLYYYDGPGWNACLNSLFLYIPVDFSGNLERVSNKKSGLNTTVYQQHYFDCGPQIDDEFDLKEVSKGKIIIIGDFVEDLAGTYLGEQPNPYLAYLAIKSLIDGKHIVVWYFIILTLAFFVLARIALSERENKSLFLFIFDSARTFANSFLKKKNKEDKESIEQNTKGEKRFRTFIRYFFGYSLDFILICTILFILFHRTFSFFIPSIFFAILGGITKVWCETDSNGNKSTAR